MVVVDLYVNGGTTTLRQLNTMTGRSGQETGRAPAHSRTWMFFAAQISSSRLGHTDTVTSIW